MFLIFREENDLPPLGIGQRPDNVERVPSAHRPQIPVELLLERHLPMNQKRVYRIVQSGNDDCA